MKKIRWGWIALLLWLLALMTAYYRTHGLLSEGFINAAGGALLDVLTVSVMTFVAGGVGKRLLARLDLSLLSRSERAALEGVVGLGVMAWYALVLGLVGLFQGIFLWGSLLIAGGITIFDAIRWQVDMRLGVMDWLPRDWWTRFWAGFVGVAMTTSLLVALTPPHGWDAMSYHLVGPARYLAEGRITAQPDNHFLGFPQGVEVLYGVAMSLFGRDTAAAPLHWWFGALGLLAIGGFMQRWLDETAAFLALALLMSAYSLWLLFGWPYVDLAVMTYGALAFLLAICWREKRETHWLILMGVCAGLALGVKYTAGGLLLALVVYVLLVEPRQIIRNGLIVGASAALVFIPWAIKGLLLYQNPVYPFVFGGLNWDAGRAAVFSSSGGGLLRSAPWQLPILPIAATIFGLEKGPTYSFTVGPWLLTAPLLLIPGWRWLDAREKSLVGDGLRLGVPLLIFWMVMAALSGIGGQIRLMMMGLPVAAVLGAVVFHSLPRWRYQGINTIVRLLLVFSLVIAALDMLRESARMRAAPYLLGIISRDTFLLDNLGTYYNLMQHLETLPEGSEVMMLWEPKSYHCPATLTCTPDILFDHWGRALKNSPDTAEVLHSWRDQGVDYVLVHDQGYQFVIEDLTSPFKAEDPLFPEARDQQMEAVWTDGISYTLYGWKQ